METRTSVTGPRFVPCFPISCADRTAMVSCRQPSNHPSSKDGTSRSPSASCWAWMRPSRSNFRKRSEEHTSELQSLMRISYAVFCLQKKNNTQSMNKRDHQDDTKHHKQILKYIQNINITNITPTTTHTIYPQKQERTHAGHKIVQ